MAYLNELKHHGSERLVKHLNHSVELRRVGLSWVRDDGKPIRDAVPMNDLLDNLWELVPVEPTKPTPPPGYEGCEVVEVHGPDDDCDGWHVHLDGATVYLDALPRHGLVGFMDEDAKCVVTSTPGPWLWRSGDGPVLGWRAYSSWHRVPARWALLDRGKLK